MISDCGAGVPPLLWCGLPACISHCRRDACTTRDLVSRAGCRCTRLRGGLGGVCTLINLLALRQRRTKLLELSNDLGRPGVNLRLQRGFILVQVLLLFLL